MLKYAFYNMINNRKFIYLTPLLLIGMILSGCGDSDEHVNASESNFKITANTKDYPVSTEYYSEISDLIVEFNNYAIKMTDENLSKSKIESMSLQYLVSLNSANKSPETEVDFEFERYMSDFKYETKMMADKMLDYSNSKDVSDRNEAMGYLNDVVETQKVIKELILKYELNI